MVPAPPRTLGAGHRARRRRRRRDPRAADTVTTLDGFDAAGPAKYDKVKVVKTGPDASAKNVLVLVPGTSAGAPYFRPLAADLVGALKGWQVWAVERRENLLEDHSRSTRPSASTPARRAVFDYYLGWIGGRVPQHFEPQRDRATSRSPARWGMDVAIGDLRRVVRSARRGGRKVVLGGHSLGGNIAATLRDLGLRRARRARATSRASC